jgi:uncharacterized repeat protein (TIGR01451 family)
MVFNDTGSPSGTANNGVLDGTETGIAGASVSSTNAACPAGVCDTTSTASNGSYTLWLPAAATGTVQVTQTNLSGYLSTGASVGNTGGTYTRSTDTIAFSNAGTSYSGVNFGDVPAHRWVTNGQQSTAPGTVVFYPHQFYAASGGTVSFGVTSTNGWPVVLYRDANCNGVLDAGEVLANGAVAVLAAERVCIVNRVTVPVGTAAGAQDTATLQASFNYTNASPVLAATLTVFDSTTVGAGTAGLVLTKTADKASAVPGDTITYTVSYQNNSGTQLSTIVISDATPAFTTLVSAACNLPLPSAITQCTIVTLPAPGGGTSVQWTLTGALNPAAVGSVVFAVRVNN